MVGEQHYLAYMVRLWPVHNNGNLVWRASVENAHTGERRAFADLAGLFAFLRIATQRPGADQLDQRQDPGDTRASFPDDLA